MDPKTSKALFQHCCSHSLELALNEGKRKLYILRKVAETQGDTLRLVEW